MDANRKNLDTYEEPKKISCPRLDYGIDGPCTDAVYGSVKDSELKLPEESGCEHSAAGASNYDPSYLSPDCCEAYDTHCERCKAPNEHNLLCPVAVEVRAAFEY